MVSSKAQKFAAKAEAQRSVGRPAKSSASNLARKIDPPVHRPSKPAHSDRGNSPLVKPQPPIGSIKSRSGIDLTEKVKELDRLAQEQGQLTYDDINDALPDTVVTLEDLDQIYTKLASLDVEIVDQAEVDQPKQPEVEEEEDNFLQHTTLYDIKDGQEGLKDSFVLEEEYANLHEVAP